MRLLLFIFILLSFSVHAEVRVSFSGEITPRSLERLERNILKAVSNLREADERIVVAEINSGGGNLYAALAFIERIRKSEADLNFSLTTRVRHSCESSCTVLFTAGKTRQATRGASFGFHSPAIESRLPKGVDRRDVLRNARERWLGAVAKVDIPLSYELDRRGLLLNDEMKYIKGRDLATGYVSEIIR